MCLCEFKLQFQILVINNVFTVYFAHDTLLFFNKHFVKLVVAVLIKKCSFTDNQDGASSPTSPHQGNGVMAQPKKIKGIGFGDIFREGSVKLRVSQRLPSDNEEKKEKVSSSAHDIV